MNPARLQKSLHLRAAAHIDELRKEGREATAAEMERLGWQIFLSDPRAAQTDGVYFCGLKPYGGPGRPYVVTALPPAGYTEYRDGDSYSPFYARARQVIRCALDVTLGKAAPLEAALCTNWYFFRAADTAQLKRFGLERIDCSAEHRQLLDTYRPRIILCAGNGPVSAYAGMLALLGRKTTEEVDYLGRSKLRRATGRDGTTIIGLPHLSRYAVTEDLLTFIRG